MESGLLPSVLKHIIMTSAGYGVSADKFLNPSAIHFELDL